MIASKGGGGGSGGSGGTGGRKRGRGAKEVVEDEDGNKYPVVAVPWNNLGLFCGLNTGGRDGGFSVKAEEDDPKGNVVPITLQGYRIAEDASMEERRALGLVWARHMCAGTARMQNVYIQKFKTAVRFNRLTEQGVEVDGWRYSSKVAPGEDFKTDKQVNRSACSRSSMCSSIHLWKVVA